MVAGESEVPLAKGLACIVRDVVPNHDRRCDPEAEEGEKLNFKPWILTPGLPDNAGTPVEGCDIGGRQYHRDGQSHCPLLHEASSERGARMERIENSVKYRENG
jgi:hypothetical protein